MTSTWVERVARCASDAERKWLNAILSATACGPAALRDLWTTAWFDESDGRALVIQAAHASALLYQRADIGRDVNADVEQTLSLAMLTDMLVRERMAIVCRPDPDRRQPIWCIGSVFRSLHVEVVVGRPRIIVNEQGDYTDDPSSIQHADGTIAWRGVRLPEEAYDLVCRVTSGMLHVRPSDRAALVLALSAAGQTDTQAASRRWLHAEKDQRAGRALASAGPVSERSAPLCRRLLAVACLLVAVLSGSAATLASCAWTSACRAGGREPTPASMAAMSATAPRTGSAAAGRSLRGPVRGGSTASQTIATPTEIAPPPSAAKMGEDLHPRDGNDLPVVDAMTDWAHGIDVSKWSGNGKTSAESVFAVMPRLDFAFARVAYGTRVDPDFAINWDLMARRLIYRGAYLFLRLDEHPARQVDVAIRALGSPRPKDLCLAIDFEEMSFPASGPLPTVDAVRSTISAALSRASAALKCTPVLYTNVKMGRLYLSTPVFARYPLWIADWSRSARPRLPASWASFAFWQRSDYVERSTDPADLDVFNGDRSDLERYTRIASRPPS